MTKVYWIAKVFLMNYSEENLQAITIAGSFIDGLTGKRRWIKSLSSNSGVIGVLNWTVELDC